MRAAPLPFARPTLQQRRQILNDRDARG
jgi:hypothetical protein